MKKLIFILTTVFTLSSFAEPCRDGDRSCRSTSTPGSTQAGAIAAGISCEGCAAYEKAENARISNNGGVLVTSDGTPVKASDGSAVKTGN